jgi:hypothetical protein
MSNGRVFAYKLFHPLNYLWYFTQCVCFINSCYTVLFREYQWEKSIYVLSTDTVSFLMFSKTWLNSKMWNLQIWRANCTPVHLFFCFSVPPSSFLTVAPGTKWLLWDHSADSAQSSRWALAARAKGRDGCSRRWHDVWLMKSSLQGGWASPGMRENLGTLNSG